MTAKLFCLVLMLAAPCLAQDRFSSKDFSGEFDGFTKPGGTVINRLDDVFTVRNVLGTISFKPDGSPVNGALVEIRGPGTSKRIMAAKSNVRGEFRMHKIPEGEYVFLVSCGGYQALFGKLIVSRHAPSPKPLRFQLGPGI
jgi:hypothetical protein